MKKKILALALCLVMLLSLAFIGCEDEETPPPPVVIPTESILSNIVFLDNKVDKTTITKVDLTDKDQQVKTINDHFFGQMIRTSDAEGNPTGITYKLFNVYNSTVISLTSNPFMEEENEAYKTTITDVSYFELDGNEDFLVVAAIYGDAEKGDVYLYNKFGVAVAEYKGVDAEEVEDKMEADYEFNTNNSSDLLSFMKKVYLVNHDEGTLTELADFNKVNFDFEDLFYVEELDSFIYYDYYDSFVDEFIIVDKNLQVVSHYEFKENLNSVEEYCIFINDNEVLYVEFISLPDDAQEYDVLFEGYKTNVKMTKANILTGEETDFPYNGFIPCENAAIHPSDEEYAKYVGYGLNPDLKNVFFYYVIESHHLVLKANLVATDANLNVIKYLDPFKQGDDVNIYTTQNGMKVLATDFGSYFIDDNGVIISLIHKGDIEQNNLWLIVDEKEIYDATNNLIYTVPENREIYAILNNSLILEEEVKDADGNVTSTKFFLWKGANNEVQLGTEIPEQQPTEGTFTAVTDAGTGYYIMSTIDAAKMISGDMSMTIAIYDDLGTELLKAEKVTNIIEGDVYGNIEQLLLEITNKAEDGTITVTYSMLIVKNGEKFLNQGE